MDHLNPAAFAERNPLLTATVLGVILLGIVELLAYFGVLSERTFDTAPRRTGRFGLMEILVTFGLVILGQAVAAAVLIQMHIDVRVVDGPTMVIRMLASQAGMLPAILFILSRANLVVDGRWRGFGFDPARGPAAVSTAVKSMLVVLPMTMLVSAIVPLLMFWATHEKPKTMAHEVLPLLKSEPWGPVKWGLILSAVVAAPIVEELVFRGMLQTAILQSGLVARRWAAIVIAAGVFAMVHAGNVEWYALPSLFMLALGLGYAYERSGSLYASMLIHAAFNSIQITILLNLPDENAAAFAAWLGTL